MTFYFLYQRYVLYSFLHVPQVWKFFSFNYYFVSKKTYWNWVISRFGHKWEARGLTIIKHPKTSRINQTSSLFDLKQNIFVRRIVAFERGKPEVQTTFVAFFTIFLHFFPFFFLIESKNPFRFVGRGLGLQGIPRKKTGLKLYLRGGVERTFISEYLGFSKNQSAFLF